MTYRIKWFSKESTGFVADLTKDEYPDKIFTSLEEAVNECRSLNLSNRGLQSSTYFRYEVETESYVYPMQETSHAQMHL